ncbi:hypothetical protein SAMN05444170_1563 [Bradyrhizobium erythrophlei]|jgi:hypothetical protein|uniref:Uncharacterized protein n=1 Tax=Bradyrhizobium erythrophlei TaxID=1437360 RepID=A0A1M7TFL6_9BRAD|nr:hypothetical protein SAMN05444170_1563 [Bradyrhizobium erythrophlei]
MLFILVQIQAGPPAFARFASEGQAGQPYQAESQPTRPRLAIARRAKAGKWRLMVLYWGFRGRGIWSKDRPRAAITRFWLGDARNARPFFVPDFPAREY